MITILECRGVTWRISLLQDRRGWKKEDKSAVITLKLEKNLQEEIEVYGIAVRIRTP